MEQKHLKIEKLVYRGNGLGHHGGKAVFVPFTVPGDTILWEVVREKKHFIQGRLLKVLFPSPDRAVPLCSDFGRCGGCQWQHINYDIQLHWKNVIVAEILGKTASVPAGRVVPILSSHSPWYYRTRARLVWEAGRVGFYQNRSHRIIPVERCALLDPRLNNVLGAVKGTLTSLSLARMGRGELLLEAGDSGSPRVILRFRPDTSLKMGTIQNALQGIISLAGRKGFSLWIDTNGSGTAALLAGKDEVALRPMQEAALSLAVPPGGFSQASLEQNRRLTALITKIVEENALSSDGKRVLDLYCGMGNLSLPMALKGGRITGIDSARASIQTARRNAVANGIRTATFICADAGDFLREYLQGGGDSCDTLVLDPPRTGAREIAELLAVSARCPETIVYVSCDPMTLARDLKILTGSAYNVLSVTPIDMFPQTFHIETVALLRKKSSR